MYVTVFAAHFHLGQNFELFFLGFVISFFIARLVVGTECVFWEARKMTWIGQGFGGLIWFVSLIWFYHVILWIHKKIKKSISTPEKQKQKQKKDT